MRPILLISSLFAASLNAQTTHLGNPLWENFEYIGEISVETIDISTEPFLEEPPVESFGAATFAVSSLTVPEAVDAEIMELAKGLNSDPLEIFNWVRNNIGYEHYYGIRKGAELTLLEGRGNDMDQCLLLAELLKAAGVSSSDIQYRRSRHRLALTHPSGVSAYDLLGLDDDPFPGQTFEQAYGFPVFESWSSISDLQAKKLYFPIRFLGERGTPDVVAISNDFNSIAFPRVWLQVNISGTSYDLDPSFKTYEEIDGLDLIAGSSYSRSALLSAAGDNTNTDPSFTENLSSTNIGNYLDGINADILSQIQTLYPNLSLAEIISGRRIIKDEAESLNNCYPMNDVFLNQIVDASTITNSLADYETKVRFEAGSINYEIPTADLKGRKVTLTFSGNTVEFRLDDASPVATTSTSADDIELTITVEHPGGILGEWDESKFYSKNNGHMYAILYGFTPSGRLLQERYKILNEYLDEGKADDSREVRTEILNIMGLTWLYQTRLSDALLANQNEISDLSHHRFGRMAQEEGFYVDVGLQLTGAASRDGVRDERFDNVFHLGSLYASALEHGIIEQMQTDASAVSTVNIIRAANEDGQRIYLANAGNWSTVEGQLQNYSDTTKNAIELSVVDDGGSSLLPRNANVSQGIWTGTGYIIRSELRAGMIIAGGYSGGYSTNIGNVSSPPITNSYTSNPFTSYTPTTSFTPTVTPPSYTAPSFLSFDPVEISTGAFYLASTDLQTGIAPAPRGLSFARSYRSNTAEIDGQNLGHGWTHNLHIRATERTAIEEGLGSGTAEQAAALLTSTLIASDLYRDDGSAKEWVTASLAVGWFTDELLNNAVSITMGKNIYQFIEQPDGSYTAPAGQTMTLRKVNEKYELEQRLGNTIFFDSEGKADYIEDIDGKQMDFVYHSDDLINYVEDAYGRRLTLGYNGDDRITTVTCSTGRSIGFRYDSEGNQDRYTDPEGKYRYYIYEASSDPDGATPIDPAGTIKSEHQIVRLRNHDKEIITQNVYDALGRVSEQYMHGDTNQTWTLRYTGACNTEENPEGGIKCFFYDERGRATATEDESGNRASWIYDGQDQIIERTSATGEVTTFTFDGNHNTTRIDFPRGGGSTINVFDSLNRLTQRTDPEGNVTQFVYAASGFNASKDRPVQIIDPVGTTTLTYFESGAAAGQLQTSTDGDGLVTEIAYDNLGQPDWTEAPGDFRTQFTYNNRGDLIQTTTPRGVETRFTQNARRQLTRTEFDFGGSIGAQSDQSFDNQGRLKTTYAPEDNDSQRVETLIEYTPTDKVDIECLVNETATLDDDIIVDHKYDGRDWNTGIEDAFSRTTTFSYFDNGELQQVERPASTTTRNSSFTYDADNRPLTQSDPGAPTIRNSSFAYNITDTAEGDMTSGYPRTVFTDPSSRSTVSEFDRLGRLRYFSNRKGFIFEFNYDGLGRQTEVITPNGFKTTTAYNHRGAPTLITEPSGQTTTFTYDSSSGRLSSQSDEVGTINYTSYDDDGNLLSLEEHSATITRTYDSLNRVTSYTDSMGQTIGYSYYPSGKLKTLNYPGGDFRLEYKYWRTGRLKTVTENSVYGKARVDFTVNTNIQDTSNPNYDPQNVTMTFDVAERGFGYSSSSVTFYMSFDGYTVPVHFPVGINGSVQDYASNGLGTRLPNALSSYENIQILIHVPENGNEITRTTSYIWNNDGRLARIDRPNGTKRIITYNSSGFPESIEERTSTNALIISYDLSYYNSDEIQSLTTAPSLNAEDFASPASLNLTYDADNRLATYQRPYVLGGQVETVTHDDDGNMLQGPDAKGVPITYTYDARNRLTSADGLSYLYDAEDNRTQISENGGSITYVTDTRGVLSRILSRTKNGSTTRYVYGVGLTYEVDESGNATYYHFDQVGNTSVLTDENESIIEQFRYSPYGFTTYQQNNYDTPFRFGGFFGIQTDSNGLVYMRARFYNPITRRFINSDPARDQWNWYAYANGNPTAFVDPNGLEPISYGGGGSNTIVGSFFNTSNSGSSNSSYSNNVITGSTAGLAGQLYQTGQLRLEYSSRASSLSQFDVDGRNNLKTEFRGRQTALGTAITNQILSDRERSGYTSSNSNATRTNANVNRTAAIMRNAGRGLAVVSIGSEVYNVATAEEGTRVQVATQAGGRLTGGAAGGYVGAQVGLVSGPWGVAAGAVVGGIAGAIGGEELVNSIFDF